MSKYLLSRYLNGTKQGICNQIGSYQICLGKYVMDNNYTCPKRCFPFSLPYQTNLPDCKTWEEWWCMKEQIALALEEVPENCNFDCTITQYDGSLVHQIDLDDPKFQFSFEIFFDTHISEEYLITSFNDLVGSFGGTLGLFTGFSFLSLFYDIFDLIIDLCRAHFVQ